MGKRVILGKIVSSTGTVGTVRGLAACRPTATLETCSADEIDLVTDPSSLSGSQKRISKGCFQVVPTGTSGGRTQQVTVGANATGTVTLGDIGENHMGVVRGASDGVGSGALSGTTTLNINNPSTYYYYGANQDSSSQTYDVVVVKGFKSDALW